MVISKLIINNNMKNKLLKKSKKSQVIISALFVLSLMIVGGGFTYANVDSAQNQNNPMSSIVNAVATNFNLNSSDVQTVVNDVMETERSNRLMQEKINQTEKINQAVTDGEITQAQADLITAKISEIKSTREANQLSNQGLTQEERADNIQAEKESLKEWAEDNNISMEFFQNRGEGHEGPGRLGGQQQR